MTHLSRCIPLVFRTELVGMCVCCVPVCIVLSSLSLPSDFAFSYYQLPASFKVLQRSWTLLWASFSAFPDACSPYRLSVICCLPCKSVFPRSAGANAAWIHSLWAGRWMTVHLCWFEISIASILYVSQVCEYLHFGHRVTHFSGRSSY